MQLRGVGVRANYPGAVHDQPLRAAGSDRQPHRPGMGHPRGTQRVDEQMDLELVFDKGLHPGTGTAESPVTQADLEDVTGSQIPVDHVDQQ